MLGRWQFSVLTAIGVLSLVLVAVNALLFTANRDAQAALAQRQQYIQQSIALESLYRDIVKALAEIGARGNDRAILDILSAQGLSVSVSGTPAAAPSSPAHR